MTSGDISHGLVSLSSSRNRPAFPCTSTKNNSITLLYAIYSINFSHSVSISRASSD